MPAFFDGCGHSNNTVYFEASYRNTGATPADISASSSMAVPWTLTTWKLWTYATALQAEVDFQFFGFIWRPLKYCFIRVKTNTRTVAHQHTAGDLYANARTHTHGFECCENIYLTFCLLPCAFGFHLSRLDKTHEKIQTNHTTMALATLLVVGK